MKVYEYRLLFNLFCLICLKFSDRIFTIFIFFYSGSRIGGTRYGKYAAAFAAGYVVHGMTRYNTRYYGSRYYTSGESIFKVASCRILYCILIAFDIVYMFSDPNICTDLDRYVEYDNGTISKTEKLQYFVCPYDNSDSANDIYCCGPDEQEYCCSYWER